MPKVMRIYAHDGTHGRILKILMSADASRIVADLASSPKLLALARERRATTWTITPMDAETTLGVIDHVDAIPTGVFVRRDGARYVIHSVRIVYTCADLGERAPERETRARVVVDASAPNAARIVKGAVSVAYTRVDGERIHVRAVAARADLAACFAGADRSATNDKPSREFVRECARLRARAEKDKARAKARANAIGDRKDPVT